MSANFNLMKSLRTRVFSKFNSLISKSFNEKYLLYTNVGLSVSLSGLGDAIQQHYEILTDDLEQWDPTRTRNMSVCGLTIGVFCHYWYQFLDRRLPGYTLRTVVKKVVVDQFIASPICISSLFVTSAILEKKAVSDLLTEMKQKAWILYAAEWTIWPPAQFINFYFLPTKYRVLYDNTISLGYDIFTSYVKHQETFNDEKDS